MNLLYPKRLLAFSLLALGLTIVACHKDNTGATTTVTSFDFMVPKNQVAGTMFSFTSSVPGQGNTFLWEFGDGTSSMASEPAHVYSIYGTFPVKLTINNDKAHSLIKEVIVAPNYTFYQTGVPIPGDSIFFHFNFAVPPGNTYTWNFGDGGTSVTADTIPAYVYSVDGAYNVSVTVSGNFPGQAKNKVTILKDPIYTHLINGMKLWHRKVTKTYLSTGSSYPQPDTSVAINFINAVTIGIGSQKFIYTPDSSQGNFLFYKAEFSYYSSSYINKVLYHYVSDSLAYIYSYDVYPASTGMGHPPATRYDEVWHTP